MRRVDCVAPICEPLRREIEGRGISANQISVVPNAVDRSLLSGDEMRPGDEQLRRHLRISGKVVLGFIGSFYSYEGLDLLLKAAARLRERHASFSVLLVGGGPDEARLRRLTSEYHLEECVHFAGRVHHSEVSRYYRLIDILVFPRRRMRLTDLVTPLKPLEAMAQSKPVLASDVGGHRELIRDGETGFLFPAGDDAALAARLEELIANPERRAHVAQQGHRYVAAERTWDRLTDIYAAIYERIAKPI
jgi:glycosyltransferase involved in cell wall biosynthesis